MPLWILERISKPLLTAIGRKGLSLRPPRSTARRAYWHASAVSLVRPRYNPFRHNLVSKGVLRYALVFFSSLSFAAVDLHSAFQTALEKTETKPIASARYEQSDEQVSQAFGLVLPRLNFVGSYTRQDNSATGAISSVSKPDQKLARFTLTQPIFRGLSDIYAYQAVKKRRDAQDAKTFQTTLSIYKTVAQSYYGLLSARKDKEDLLAQTDLTNKRIREIQERVKIGRSRIGDRAQDCTPRAPETPA